MPLAVAFLLAAFAQSPVAEAELSAARAIIGPASHATPTLVIAQHADMSRDIYENWALDVAGPLILEERDRVAQQAGPADLARTLALRPGLALDLRIATTSSNICCTR